VRLQDTAQHTADFTIYNSIVCGPWLLLFLLIGFPTWRLARRLGLIERAQERIVSRTNRNDVRHVVTGNEELIEEEDDEQS
jgi:hypothetical protein